MYNKEELRFMERCIILAGIITSINVILSVCLATGLTESLQWLLQ